MRQYYFLAFPDPGKFVYKQEDSILIGFGVNKKSPAYPFMKTIAKRLVDCIEIRDPLTKEEAATMFSLDKDLRTIPEPLLTAFKKNYIIYRGYLSENDPLEKLIIAIGIFISRKEIIIYKEAG